MFYVDLWLWYLCFLYSSASCSLLICISLITIELLTTPPPPVYASLLLSLLILLIALPCAIESMSCYLENCAGSLFFIGDGSVRRNCWAREFLYWFARILTVLACSIGLLFPLAAAFVWFLAGGKVLLSIAFCSTSVLRLGSKMTWAFLPTMICGYIVWTACCWPWGGTSCEVLPRGVVFSLGEIRKSSCFWWIKCDYRPSAISFLFNL